MLGGTLYKLARCSASHQPPVIAERVVTATIRCQVGCRRINQRIQETCCR